MEYFGHSQERAREMLAELFRLHANRYDEDRVHHEAPYRIAAIVHYVQELGGRLDEAKTWLLESGHNNTPPDALEYFREHFFVDEAGADIEQRGWKS